MPDYYDVAVIGGGPAGLATAIASARAGLSVLLTELRQPPVDKLCGEGILPDGCAALRLLGIAVEPASGHGLCGIRFTDVTRSFAAAFPSGAGIGLRRTVLHDLLRRAAEREGVDLHWGARAEIAGPGQIRIGKHTLRCRYLVGADGQRSLVRQAARLGGSHATLRDRQRLAYGAHYSIAPWTDHVEVHWGCRIQAYVTPVGPSEVGVAYLTRRRDIAPGMYLTLFPALAERLADAAQIGPAQGGCSLMLQLEAVTRENIALVGEASGCVDAITGEGLSLAFRQAMAVADAMRAGDLLHYEREHRRIQQRPRLMAHLLLSLSEHPRWRKLAFHLLRQRPQVFASLLAMHIGGWPGYQATRTNVDHQLATSGH